MESNITYIEGKVGIPHPGYLKCDGTTLTLIAKDKKIFTAPVTQISAVKYTGHMSFTVVLNDNKQYIFQDVDWGDKRNLVRWFLFSFIAVIVVIIVALLTSNISFLYFAFVVPVLAITYQYRYKLKKVQLPNGMPPNKSLVLAWRQYFSNDLKIKLESQDSRLT